MNIGIFETQHFEGAYPMIRIMDIPGNRLTIFVNEDTHRRFTDLFAADMIRYKWVVQPAGVSNRRFVWQIFQTCKTDNIALLFLNTVSANFMLYAWAAALLPSTKVILTLHDANNFLKSSFSLHPRKGIRHAGKKALAYFCYAFSTVSETVREHMIISMGVKKKVFCIPGAVFEQASHVRRQYDGAAPLTIVVPGSIDKRRRDYSKVFALLEALNKQSLPVSIVLAGGPCGAYGQKIIHMCRAYCLNHTNLFYYETPVLDQPVFDAALDDAHFVWIPSVIKTVIADDIEEEYGLTKSSGNIFDAIKHAKPMLVPTGLTMPPSLQSSVLTYASIGELTGFLTAITKLPESYAQLANEALSNSLKYTTEKVRDSVRELF